MLPLGYISDAAATLDDLEDAEAIIDDVALTRDGESVPREEEERRDRMTSALATIAIGSGVEFSEDLPRFWIGPPEAAMLPSLTRVTIAGLRKSDAQAIKKRWKALPQLEIRGAKNDAWVAANAENPLRDWVDDEPRFGERACKAYTKAYKLVEKASEKESARASLLDFVRALNKLDKKVRMIDTFRRDQAYEAFLKLAAVADVSEDDASEWFDAERDF